MRSTIKWGGAVLTILLLIVWVGSRWCAGYTTLVPSLAVQADAGRVLVTWMSNPPMKYQGDLYVRQAVPGALFRWWFTVESKSVWGNRVAIVAIPGWALVIAAATPTFLIWRRDRRRMPNLCPHCDYDRTGLPADRACPECGKTQSPKSK